MKHRVYGAWEETGNLDEVIIEAASVEEAVSCATANGMLVLRAERVEFPEIREPELRWDLGGYAITVSGRDVNVSGPNKGLATLVGRRFISLLESEEGRFVLKSR